MSLSTAPEDVLSAAEESADEHLADMGAKPSAPSQLELLLAEHLSAGDSNKTRIDKLARLMFNDGRVRKICRHVSLKCGVDINDVDDVLQRSMEVFFGKMLAKMRTADAVYAVVYAVASNVSKEVLRESRELVIDHDSIEDMREAGKDIHVSDVVDGEEEDHEALVDTRIFKGRMAQAFAKLANGVGTLSDVGVFGLGQGAELLPLVSAVAAKQDEQVLAEPVQSKGKPRSVNGKPVRDLSRDQQELVDIMKELDMRSQDFAAQIGIGLPRLSSYIYGRTATVPAEVMKRARELRDEQVNSHSAVKQRFQGKMSEIVAEWETLLSPKTNDVFASYLGVTTMTLHRWRHDETRPDMTALVRYDSIVRRTAEALNSALKRAAETAQA